ncbi:JmjC domain-containing histone demethylation protein 1, partial [Coemansia erecta]
RGKVDYTMLNEGQPATFNQYLLRLDEHEFLEDEFEHLDEGTQVTREWIRNRDTNDPFIVKCATGLDMIMPASDITVEDIALAVGKDVPVSVMDVLSQDELKGWTMSDWASYFHSTNRQRVLNVISLEITDTPFGEQIRRPRVVDDIDAIEKYWPESKRKPNRYPKVKTYCLMSVRDAYTDFHVDFSATWVYYHVLSGEKVFYLVPPTPSNMRKFESWSKSPEQAVSLFAEHVKQCFEVHVKAGNTMFIPAGWIHAVFTPVDTIVIGGNFMVMQSLNTHIGAYKLEARTRVPTRYRFPFFIKMCRYMVELLARKWDRFDKQTRAKWTLSELEGAFVLASFLDDKLLGRDCDADEAKALGDKAMVRKHATSLLELVGAELASRMLPEEWLNREPQLREGSHFRWVRPGMSQGSLLLAARPRRTRAAAGIDSSADKRMTKIRKKAAERSDSTKGARSKLVRGRPKSSASDSASNGDGPNGIGDDKDEASDNEDVLAILGTGNRNTRRRRQRRNISESDESETDGGTDSNDSSSDNNSNDDGADDSGDDSSGSDTSSSSDDDGFIVSDSDEGPRSSKKRKLGGSAKNKSARKISVQLQQSVRLKGAKQRIAERLKIKF